jgi:hypothetical protein
MVALVVVLGAVVYTSVAGVVEEAKDANEKPVPVSGDLLANGGFEGGYTGAWEGGFDTDLPQGGALIRAERPRVGACALQVDGSPSFVGQDVTDQIDPGRTYRLCASTALADPGAVVYVGVQFCDDPDPVGATIGEKSTYRVDWTTYTEECVLAEIGTDQAAESAEVRVYRGSGSGRVFVDDVSLVRMRYFADLEVRPDD